MFDKLAQAARNNTQDMLDCTDRSAEETALAYSGSDRFLGVSQIKSADAEAYMADRTIVSYDFNRHGTQIEYTAADGTAHLWYPGNERILHGRWKVERQEKSTEACFAYGKNTHNPQTGHEGAGFECGPFKKAQYFDVDSVQGDAFGLAASQGSVKPLPDQAVKPYVPSCLPFVKPYRTNGKSPIEHLLEDLGKAS
ncbi:hypothetical protein D1F64_15435 [Breoghania sp. L-A4]|nr:hypothetical protein D1F64_15435 [Breoghania sp. L-A4]